ncbi:MAG: Ig-like domain-containing protein [Bacteroidales bacterium]|nr:Ig-like domain-containing protein [Bacteroidales bacterium]
MKTRHSFQTVLVVFLLCLIPLLSGCRKEVETVIVKPNSLVLSAGETYWLKAGVFPEKAPQDVKWSSSNSRVASVDGNGLLTAISSGSCKITASAGSVSATCVVRVNGKPAEYSFTVSSDGRRVQFSPGNLQYNAFSNSWRFAEHQYDFVGDGGKLGGNVPESDNCLIDSAYGGWIDLFGWMTSGWHDENNADHLHYQPWSSSYEINDGIRTGYGPSEEMEDVAAGTRYDWGVNNSIYNPRTGQKERAGTWRTLTSFEWKYLVEERSTNTDFRYAKAMVNGVKGLVIFPDEWEGHFVFQNPNREKGCLYEDNTLNDSDWLFCESEGCIFLPAAGYRQGAVAISTGSEGRYWSISRYRFNGLMSDNKYGKDLAFVLKFNENTLVSNLVFRYYGCSVRLVKSLR